MSAKLIKIDDAEIGEPDLCFFCPGCKCYHGVWLKKDGYKGPVWEFNGDMERPTISPSVLVQFPCMEKMNVCHSFIRNGRIQYLSDCTHELAGKTIELPEI